MLLAAPWLIRALFTLALRGRPGSRIRRAAITRALRVGLAANNRGDYKALSAFLSPEIEMHMFPDAPEARPADIEPIYHGREGYLRLLDTWKAPFQENRWDVHEVMDPGGDRFGARLELVSRGGGSGIEVRQTQYGVWQIERGFARRQWALMDEAAVDALL